MSYKKGLFEGVPNKKVNKSRFNLSHEYKAQLIPGTLVPILTMETMPGDEWSIDTEFMFRFSPLYFPVMHKVTMRADYYYTPYRILWNETGAENVGWKKWIAEQEEIPLPTMNPNMRYFTGGFNNNLLAYMGIPMIPLDGIHTLTISDLSAFPLSAYLKIWDEYERIPQLEEERWFNLESGNNTPDFLTAFAGWVETASPVIKCLPSKWEKDYLTSALPQPQVGEAILIPSMGIDPDTGEFIPTKVFLEDGTVPANFAMNAVDGETQVSTQGPVALETQATIKQLRLSEVLQTFYERIMKVGTRYRDFIKGLYEDDPEPMAVDVPVLFGSKFGRVQIADVMTQTYTDSVAQGDRKTGDYVGQMNLYENGGGNLNYYCREHGLIMCILQVNPNTSYGQGIARFWRREVQTDFPLDIFSGIGDQEILKEEVVYNPVTAFLAKNNDTFGYIPRFSEMRYMNNIQVGQINFTGGKSQHIGRIWDDNITNSTNYDNLEINDVFVNTLISDTANDSGGIRITDVWRSLPDPDGNTSNTGEGTIYAHIFHSIYVNRALPMYSTPKLS